MSPTNDEMNDLLYSVVKKSIDNLFSDKRVSKEKAIINMRALIEHIEMLIDSLEEDGDA